MTKKFLTSVAKVWGYNDATGALLFVGNTLLDSSIATTLAKTDVKGGYGNQLLYVYYHTADMTMTISDAQWNLDFLASTVGSGITAGTNDVFYEETLTLSAGKTVTITNTPLTVNGTVVYGWMTHVDGTVETITFTGGSKTCDAVSGGTVADVVCVRYYKLNTAARSLTINANIIPNIVHLVMDAQLNSSDSTTNQIGIVEIDVPKATLEGAFTIKMTPDGVASTPLTARALANTDTTTGACTNTPYYAKIKEILSSANWYDPVIGIAIEGGDFSLARGVTGAIHVWAVPAAPGLPFLAPTTGTEMTFASSDTGIAGIGANSGIIIPTAQTGTALLHATITAKTAIDANVTLTVT